ncbi:hypothetical protein [Aeromonas caviae]|uniref:hypothetical protein n=1 Tax=Aeromonas caviae TaxID=648 RepID=UPI003F74A6F0
MSGTNRGKSTILELVFPPISNQEAYWLKDQPAATLMRASDFYMIGGKAKSKFTNLSACEETMIVSFDLCIGDDVKGSGAIEVPRLKAVENYEGDKFGVGAGAEAIQIFYEKDGCNYLIERFTPENILWHRSREIAGVSGLDNYKDLFCYDLLYVGIAKKGDTYERLIKNGHHARLDILANEPQRYPGARVTDEIFLFLFRLNPLFVTTFGPDAEIDLDFAYDHKRIVADAEKAFVSLLQPNYNTVKFSQYPKGADGLHNSKLDRYTYSIGEAITFNTAHGKIKGGRNRNSGGLTNEADFIFVDKNSSRLFISGQDFDEDQWT